MITSAMPKTAHTVRPATARDIASYSTLARTPTARVWVAEADDGSLIAMGGIGLAQGRWFAFLDLHPQMRSHKVTIARNAVRFLEACRRDGIRFIYAEADATEPSAVRWLTRLGFTPYPNSNVYRWSSH